MPLVELANSSSRAAASWAVGAVEAAEDDEVDPTTPPDVEAPGRTSSAADDELADR